MILKLIQAILVRIIPLLFSFCAANWCRGEDGEARVDADPGGIERGGVCIFGFL